MTETILVVDDQEEVAKLMQEMLRALGYSAEVCHSGAEALECFTKEPNKFNLVITDQTMPKMLGTELAQRISQIRPDIRIIIITGFSEETIRLANNIKKIVMKPIRLAELKQAVEKVLAD